MQNETSLRGRGTLQGLTGREVEALHLAGNGHSMKAIGQILGISAGTVSWHLKNSYQKLGVGCRDDALRKARAQNLIRTGEFCPACASSIQSGLKSGGQKPLPITTDM